MISQKYIVFAAYFFISQMVNFFGTNGIEDGRNNFEVVWSCWPITFLLSLSPCVCVCVCVKRKDGLEFYETGNVLRLPYTRPFSLKSFSTAIIPRIRKGDFVRLQWVNIFVVVYSLCVDFTLSSELRWPSGQTPGTWYQGSQVQTQQEVEPFPEINFSPHHIVGVWRLHWFIKIKGDVKKNLRT